MLEDEVVNSKKVPKLPDSHGNGTSTTSSTGGGGGNNLRTVIDSVSSITNSISVINIAVNQCLDFARSQNGRVGKYGIIQMLVTRLQSERTLLFVGDSRSSSNYL